MFKRLGTFAVLAVCLFAIAIVMVGCGGGGTDDEEEVIDSPPPTSSSLSPAYRKIVGSYTASRGGSGNNPDWKGYLTLSSDNTFQIRWIGRTRSEDTGRWTVVDGTTLILDGVRHSYTYTDKIGGSTTRSPVALVLNIDGMKTPDGRGRVQWFREGIENLF